MWTTAGLVTFAVTAFALARQRAVSSTLLIVAAAGVVASPPFFQVLIHGQTTFFLLAGFALLWQVRVHAAKHAGDRRRVAADC